MPSAIQNTGAVKKYAKSATTGAPKSPYSCPEVGAALTGVAGRAFRGFAFASDNTLYTGDAGVGLQKWVAAAPQVGTASLTATWTLALSTMPGGVGGGGIEAVHFRRYANGGYVFATAAAPVGGNALFRYALASEASAAVPQWTLISRAAAGSRFKALYAPPRSSGVFALPTETPIPTPSPTRTGTRKPKLA